MTESLPSRTRDSVKYFQCPNCVQCPQGESITQTQNSELEYIYLLQFLVIDNSHSLLLQLWKEQAVKFFNNIEPASLLKDRERFVEIKRHVNRLVECESQRGETLKLDDNPPYMECCVMAYSTDLGLSYQIFDTQLCMDEGSQL